MKFYPRYVGDIMKKTSGLTMAQFGAYDRLTDWLYANETSIDPDEVYIITHAQTAADRRDVDKVLAKYFTCDDKGFYVQERVEETIAAALPKIQAARENGRKGGRPSKAKLAALAALKEPTGLFEETQLDPNSKTSQSHIQNGSEANASAAGAAPGSVDKSAADMTKAELWAAGKSLLEQQGMPAAQCGTFIGKLVKDYDAEVVHAAVVAAVGEQPADAASYLKATCMRKKGERRDPVTVPSDDYAKTKAAHAAADAQFAAQDPEERQRRIAEAKRLLVAKKAEGATV